MERRADGLTALAFATSVVVGGGNGVAIVFSNKELALDWGAGLRFAGASLIFFLLVRLTRSKLPRGRALLGTVVFGVFNFAIAFALIYWALRRIPPGRAQTILAIVPLLTILLAAAHRQERFRWRGLAGALLALIGIGVIFGFGKAGGAATSLVAVAALLGAAFCFAEATVLIKGFPRVPPASLNAVATGTGAIVLFLISLMSGERWAVPSRASTWAALAFLWLGGTVVVFSLYLYVLRRWPASVVSYQFVLLPISAVLASAWLLGEALTVSLLTGGLLVLAGVYVGALGLKQGSACRG
jgi:drug/metabolite transporter (DMT)-like permease